MGAARCGAISEDETQNVGRPKVEVEAPPHTQPLPVCTAATANVSPLRVNMNAAPSPPPPGSEKHRWWMLTPQQKRKRIKLFR